MTDSAAAEPRFVEFTQFCTITGSRGEFFIVEGTDPDTKKKNCLRIDGQFKDLVEDEFAALEAGDPASFYVAKDPQREQSNDFRIVLAYYRARKAAIPAMEEMPWDNLPSPQEQVLAAPPPEQLKAITTHIPLLFHQRLHELHKRQIDRFPRFSDFLSAVLCRSATLLELT